MTLMLFSSLSSGTLLTKSPGGQLIPLDKVSVSVVQHLGITPVPVYPTETGGSAMTQPLTTNSDGQIPGYVNDGQVVDLVVASPRVQGGSGTIPCWIPPMAGGGSGSGGGILTSILTGKGDDIGASAANTPVHTGPPSSDGLVMTSQSSATAGKAWLPPTGGGSGGGPARPVTGTYTLATTDGYVLVDATLGAFNLTLPTAIGATAVYSIRAITGGLGALRLVTLTTTGGQLLDGLPSGSVTLGTPESGATYLSATVVSDESNWWVF